MPTLDDVYRKFGETAEAAQLLETDLGTIALMIGCLGKPRSPKGYGNLSPN